MRSYNARESHKPLSGFSSSGPTRDGRQKPEISAPGHRVRAAFSKTLTGNISMSGTSMAAPVVTGVVALMLSEARAQGKNLDIAEIRSVLTGTARTNATGWDERYGFGRVDAKAVINKV